MKRFLYIILIGLTMLILVACGKAPENENLGLSTEGQTETEGLNEETDESVQVEQEEEEIKTYYVKGSTVNFRAEPSMSGEVICRLTKGTELTKIAAEGDWLYVSCGETSGYIHKDYASTYLPAGTVEGEVRIIVKKAERTLELWQGDTMIISAPVGLGWAPVGHKQVEGDGKTPEGEYYICVRNSNSAYYLSLGVSYPNKKDAAAALADGRINRETYERIATAIDNGRQPDWDTPLGGAIMIHGWGSASDWSAGCIAVDNYVMDILFEYCPLRTKITILP